MCFHVRDVMCFHVRDVISGTTLGSSIHVHDPPDSRASLRSISGLASNSANQTSQTSSQTSNNTGETLLTSSPKRLTIPTKHH